MKHSIVRNCDSCGKEDSINTMSGLCPDCDFIENYTEEWFE